MQILYRIVRWAKAYLKYIYFLRGRGGCDFFTNRPTLRNIFLTDSKLWIRKVTLRILVLLCFIRFIKETMTRSSKFKKKKKITEHSTISMPCKSYQYFSFHIQTLCPLQILNCYLPNITHFLKNKTKWNIFFLHFGYITCLVSSLFKYNQFKSSLPPQKKMPVN